VRGGTRSPFSRMLFGGGGSTYVRARAPTTVTVTTTSRESAPRTHAHTHTYASVWNEQRDDGTVAVSFVTSADTSGLHVVVVVVIVVVVVNRPARTGCRPPIACVAFAQSVFVRARRTSHNCDIAAARFECASKG